MKNKRFRDIRFYEKNNKSVSMLEQIFSDDREFAFLSQRIAQKLYEEEFSLGEADLLYICLNDDFPENQLEIIPDKYINWKIDVNFGVKATKFNALPKEAQIQEIKRIIFKTLNYLKPESNQLFRKIEEEINQFGKFLKFKHISKETTSYKVNVEFQIAINDTQSKAFITYHDKKNNQTQEFEYLLEFFEDIYPLMKDISVKNQQLIINPKKSVRAEIYNQHYQTPIVFKLK